MTVAILLALWGGMRIIGELRRLPAILAAVVEQDEPEVAALFRGVDSTPVPLLLTAASMVVLPIDEARAVRERELELARGLYISGKLQSRPAREARPRPRIRCRTS